MVWTEGDEGTACTREIWHPLDMKVRDRKGALEAILESGAQTKSSLWVEEASSGSFRSEGPGDTQGGRSQWLVETKVGEGPVRAWLLPGQRGLRCPQRPGDRPPPGLGQQAPHPGTTALVVESGAAACHEKHTPGQEQFF